MNKEEVKVFYTPDYIYVPYNNKEELILKKAYNKGDNITKEAYSSVSGKPYAYSVINNQNVLVIENNFKDININKKGSISNIYKIKKENIINIFGNLDNKSIVLDIKCKNNYDIKSYYILRDNIYNILETLNLLDTIYNNIKINILINKKDSKLYRLLFTYLGTYPNFNIIYNSNTITYSIYDIIDKYNLIKNNYIRDYLYISIYYKDINICKVKKYTNLKELLNYMNITPKQVNINGNIKLSDYNYILDDKVNYIIIK